MITTGSYNDGNRGFKDWKEQEENDLLEWLDKANAQGAKFALSNMFSHLGKNNEILIEWAKKYNVHYIDSDYSNCNYQLKDKTNSNSVEVLLRHNGARMEDIQRWLGHSTIGTTEKIYAHFEEEEHLVSAERIAKALQPDTDDSGEKLLSAPKGKSDFEM